MAKTAQNPVCCGRFSKFLTLACSSGLGLGYMPMTPGTFGTLLALPLWACMAAWSIPIFALTTALLIIFSMWIAGRAEAIYGEHDVGRIVIDEVVGMLVTVVGVPFAWSHVLTAFLLFRVLDIVKPPPIGWFDRKVSGGVGVVLDDVVAGLIGCALLHGARWLHGGWW